MAAPPTPSAETTPTTPTTPPAQTEPSTPPASGTTTPTPTDGPAAAPTPSAEATPTAAGSTGTVTPLPAAPDSPRARPDVLLGPAVVDAGVATGGGKAAATAPLVTVTGGPTPLPKTVAASSLGGPADPSVALADTTTVATPATLDPAAVHGTVRPDFETTLFEPSAATAPPTRSDAAGGQGVDRGDRSGDNPFAEFAAPGGPVPAGSSLLAVLASYVIPGGGSLPGTTLFFLVQLAVILAAFVAPRAGQGGRALALGRLGPRSGYRTVLARPG